jgi:hypothetical protein
MNAGFVTWVEQHAAVVQAGATAVETLTALVTLVLVVVLVRMTTQYVRLTERLTRAAITEEQHRRTSALARRAELVGIVDRLRQAVQSLTRPSADHNGGAAPWTEDDIANLETLTTIVQPDRALETARLAGDLRWLRDRVREVQRTSRLTGLDATAKGFPSDEWTKRLANARTVLDGFAGSIAGA